jgi:ATP synthase subunit 6
MIFESHLEQFEVVPIFVFPFFNSLTFTNSSMLMALVLIISSGFFSLSTYKAKVFPDSWQVAGEKFYSFVYSVAFDSLGNTANRYFPLLFSVFTFILFSNLLGLIPYSFTITSHLIITFGLALGLFAGINVVGFKKHGLGLLSLWYPGKAPFALIPMIVVIEAISYIFRVVSLSVRLFANMMAGHALLKILAGFGWVMFFSGSFLLIPAAFFPTAAVFAVMILETGVACVQSYVFLMLICMYLHDALFLH